MAVKNKPPSAARDKKREDWKRTRPTAGISGYLARSESYSNALCRVADEPYDPASRAMTNAFSPQRTCLHAQCGVEIGDVELECEYARMRIIQEEDYAPSDERSEHGSNIPARTDSSRSLRDDSDTEQRADQFLTSARDCQCVMSIGVPNPLPTRGDIQVLEECEKKVKELEDARSAAETSSSEGLLRLSALEA